MVVFHNDIINAIAQARNIRHLLASDILERWQQGEEATAEQTQSLIQLGDWIDFLTDSEQLIVEDCIDSTDVWNIIQKIGEQAIGLDCVGTNYNYNNPPPTPTPNVFNYVESVTGLNTNNADPQNPVVRISVDGVTITGDGTPASPLVASIPPSGVQSVTDDGNGVVSVDNTDPVNPIVEFNGVSVDPLTMSGDGTPSNPLSSIGGGSQTLAQTLNLGNTSGANDIEFDASQGLLFNNSSRLREGTIDAGLGGNKGIAQICGVGFELKWEAGRLYVMGSSGNTIRQSLYNFSTAPTATDDNTLGYGVGSLWTLDDGTTYECTDATTGAAVWINRGSCIISITEFDLANLETAGTLYTNALYMVTDSSPYKVLCKAETASQLSRTAQIVDAVYAGSVNYDVQSGDMYSVAISDLGNKPNQWFGVDQSLWTLGSGGKANIFYSSSDGSLGDSCASNTFEQSTSVNILGNNCANNTFKQLASTNTLGESCAENTFEQGANTNTLGVGCTQNTFKQYAGANILGNGCTQNTFEQSSQSNELGINSNSNTFGALSSSNILGISNEQNTFEQYTVFNTLGDFCFRNTFKKGANGFIFGDNLQNVTIESDLTGADYTAGSYSFLYGKDYSSVIFKSGTLLYHRYYDIANDRIVITDMATPANVTYIGGGGGSSLLFGTATQISAGAYTATISGATSYTAGDTYVITFTSANDGASKININGQGAVDIFKNTSTPISSGDIKANQTVIIVYDGTNFQAIGLMSNQLLAYVHNAQGSTITKGQVVYAFGASGNKMSVKLAQADDDATSAKTIGMVYDTSIAAGGEGYIIIQGVIEGVNTGAFTAGDTLYLSGTTAGGVTATPTYAPTHRVYVGIVERANAGNGQIYVRCQNGYELDEIHDVSAQTPANKDGLFYNSTTGLWEARQVAATDINANVSNTEFGYLDGVTSSIQTQINNAQTLSIECIAGTITSPVDLATYYWCIGGTFLTASTSVTGQGSKFAYAFEITGITIRMTTTTAGSAEDSTLYLRNITTSTSTLMGTFKTNGNLAYTSITGLAISCNTTDEYCLEMRSPTWATNPANLRLTASLFLRRT